MKILKTLLPALAVILLNNCTEPRYDNMFDPQSNNFQEDGEEYYDNVSFNDNLPGGTINIDNNTRLELHVSWHGYVKEVKWFRNGNPLNNDIHTIEGGRQDDSFIRDFAQSNIDDGEYHCVLIDAQYNEIPSNKVIVNIEDDWNPSITNGPNDYFNVEVGSNVKFGVELDGIYDSIKWFRNGNFIFGNPTNKSDTLVIGDCQLTDAGIYHAKVWFEGEQDFQRSNDGELTVQNSTVSSMVFDKNLPSDITIAEGKDTTLEVLVRNFVGNMNYTWYLSHDNTPSGDDVMLASGPSNAYMIQNPNISDHGGKWIYCVVEDDKGDLRSDLCRIYIQNGTLM